MPAIGASQYKGVSDMVAKGHATDAFIDDIRGVRIQTFKAREADKSAPARPVDFWPA